MFLEWVRDKLGLGPTLEPPAPSYGYPEPMLIGSLLNGLTAYIPSKRADGNAPEYTPVKVERMLDEGVSEMYDIAYFGYNRNTEQIVLTLR